MVFPTDRTAPQDPMNTDVTSPEERTSPVVAADLVALAKPRITVLVLVTMLGGMFMADRALPSSTAVLVTLGTILIVAGANALNMYLERDIDRHMARTENRPLPAGRMAPSVALAFGLLVSAAAIPVLLLASNLTTTLLAVAANLSYVCLYTPLKQRSWLAVIVGAVPGAIPPLFGYTAAHGSIDMPGLSLFAILFVWQVPHFHAIALFRSEDYGRAGLHVLPNDRGVAATKLHIVVSTALLVLVSVTPFVLGMVSVRYLFVELVLGAVFCVWALAGLRPQAGNRWARSFFIASMPYLVFTFVALLATRVG